LVCILLAASGVAYSVTVSDDGFTEFYLLNRTSDGELTAEKYPTEFDVGDSRSLVVGVRNNEEESVTYTVVPQIQRVDAQGGKREVLERDELDQFSFTAGPNQKVLLNHTVTPMIIGTELRLTYLLYRGSTPAEPTADNAYREVHLMINVSEPADGLRHPIVMARS
jgi:uncharacterized membrane protein